MTDERELDAVLPLTERDVPRARLLFRTLERSFEPLRTCHVVVPDRELGRVAPALPPHRYVVRAESELVPELRRFRRSATFRKTLHLAGPTLHGWYVQQLVKLAVARDIATPFYVTLDADVLCVRRVRYGDLVRDGRAIAQTPPPHHPEWNDDAERVLALPRSGRQWGVTPAVLSREAVTSLAEHLTRRIRPRLRRCISWRGYLLRNLPWTEYALYFTFVEATGRLGRCHILAGENALYDNCVWMESQFPAWRPEAGTAPFTLVQSATRIGAEAVEERMRPLLRDRARAGARRPSLPNKAVGQQGPTT